MIQLLFAVIAASHMVANINTSNTPINQSINQSIHLANTS